MTKRADAKPCLFTIGHSCHEITEFIALLGRHGVNAVADVRSQPYSRFHSQFNREALTESLQRAGIQYVFLGDELGARRSEPDSYQDNQARYDLIARIPAFHDGLGRLRRGVVSRRIALLCAEKDPITCHRMVLVCRHLRSEPVEIRHILADGSLESMDSAEARLLDAVGLPATDLFRSRAELIEEAYDLQAERIAYSEPEVVPTENGVKA